MKTAEFVDVTKKKFIPMRKLGSFLVWAIKSRDFISLIWFEEYLRIRVPTFLEFDNCKWFLFWTVPQCNFGRCIFVRYPRPQ